MNKGRTKTIRIVATVALLFLATLVYTPPISAGNDDVTIGKKGEVHFNIPVKVAGVLLQPGMYQVQHAIEGSDHFISFKQMEMPAGYRHSNTPVAKEATARIKCRVEPADKKVNNTKVTLRTNAAGEKEIAEVQIAGEGFRHLL